MIRQIYVIPADASPACSAPPGSALRSALTRIRAVWTVVQMRENTDTPGLFTLCNIECGDDGVELGRHEARPRCVFVSDFQDLIPSAVVNGPIDRPGRLVSAQKHGPTIPGPALDRMVKRRDRPANTLASLQSSQNKGGFAAVEHAGSYLGTCVSTCVQADVVEVVAPGGCLRAVQISDPPPERREKCIARHFTTELLLVGDAGVQRADQNARLAHFFARERQDLRRTTPPRWRRHCCCR